MIADPARSLAASLVALMVTLGLLSLEDLRAQAQVAAGGMVLGGLLILLLRPGWRNVHALLSAAILIRLPLLFIAPTLSDDLYRYLWEGEVWRAGFNPFRLAPDAPELSFLHDGIWELVNHREVSSVYPPLAQFLFFLLAPTGILGWKLAMGACDVGSALLLFRRRPEAGWLWALLPLCAVESAGSAHLEGAGVLALLLGLGGSSVGAWLGAMLKLLPGILLPRLVPPRLWVWPLLATVAAIALMDAGPTLFRGLETYRSIWTYNGSIYSLFHGLGFDDHRLRWTLQGIGAFTVATILLRSRDPGRIALWSCGAFVLLSPTVHPWYVLWPLAAALWNGMAAWNLLAALVPLSYVVLATYDPASSTWQESTWVRWVEYPLFYLLLLEEGWRRLRLPSPAPVF